MARRKRAFGPALLTNSAAQLYLVPAGRQGVVTHLHGFNISANEALLTISIGADASGVRIWKDYVVLSGAPFDDYGPYTLEEGEQLQAFTTPTGVLTFTVDVEEVLDGPS